MSECYVTKRGYQFKCDKPLHMGILVGGDNMTIFLLRTFE